MVGIKVLNDVVIRWLPYVQRQMLHVYSGEFKNISTLYRDERRTDKKYRDNAINQHWKRIGEIGCNEQLTVHSVYNAHSLFETHNKGYSTFNEHDTLNIRYLLCSIVLRIISLLERTFPMCHTATYWTARWGFSRHHNTDVRLIVLPGMILNLDCI